MLWVAILHDQVHSLLLCSLSLKKAIVHDCIRPCIIVMLMTLYQIYLTYSLFSVQCISTTMRNIVTCTTIDLTIISID